MKTTPIITLVAVALGGCASAPAPSASKAVTYDNTIKAVMSERCMACHGPDAPLIADFDKDKDGWKAKNKGPRMDTYENLMTFINGSDAGALMRRLDDGKNTKDGKPGNMYANLANDDAGRAARLEQIKKWIGTWNLKRRADWTPAELAAVKAPKS
jgi:mono/diheme cytochrome c family protein